MQHKRVKCYVDDLAVKSKRKEDHLKDLREVFLRFRKHKLRMNPLKCFFGVSSGQALADFLIEHPLPKDSPLRDDLLDEPVYNVETSSPNASWNMYFDGATRTNERGKLILRIGILFVSPNKYMISHAFSLLEPCSNNAAEYQSLIIGFELTLEFGITMLEAFGNSQLIVNQVNQKYEIRKLDLLPYYNKAQSLCQKFDICHITHIRRGENIRADALARLTASMAIQEGENMQITVCQRRILTPLNTH
ncbi:hypothetical protein AAC387_Pa05g1110 [Persea americana]